MHQHCRAEPGAQLGDLLRPDSRGLEPRHGPLLMLLVEPGAQERLEYVAPDSVVPVAMGMRRRSACSFSSSLCLAGTTSSSALTRMVGCRARRWMSSICSYAIVAAGKTVAGKNG